MGKFVDELRPKFADSTEPTLADFKEGTVAWVIQRYIEEVHPMKAIGTSHMYTLRRLQNAPIGKRQAARLKKSDVIDHCRARKAAGTHPATINQDVTYLTGPLKYAPAAWDDCEEVSDAAVSAAKPLLVKYQLIAKSTPRKRVPASDELDRLLAYFAIPPKKKAKDWIYAMPDIIAFALASTRRLGEICRIMHGDIVWDHKDAEGNPAPMYKVRDLKHPTRKSGNDKWFPLFPELVEIIKRQPRYSMDATERVFPFLAKSVGAKYTRAKKELGIKNLRFHDNRREAITRWLKVLKNPHQVKLISGHETTHILERVYDATDGTVLHEAVAKAVQEMQGYRRGDSPLSVATKTQHPQ